MGKRVGTRISKSKEECSCTVFLTRSKLICPTGDTFGSVPGDAMGPKPIVFMEKYFLQLIEHNRMFIDQNRTIIALLRQIADSAQSPHISLEESHRPLSAGGSSPVSPDILPITVHPVGCTKTPYTDEELMTIKEAQSRLGVSRWKIYDMRKREQLTRVERDGGVRLVKAEVEAARLWYSVPKGKI